MPGRGQANIGIWPKSSGYSRCLDITWNAKATIVTFCSDFVVRECLHSLFATTLLFPFSEENKTLIETTPSLFVDTALTNGAGLCRKNPALRNLHQCCKCCASARNESAKRCNNFTRCLHHHYCLTHVIDERQQLVHSTSAFRHLHLWEVLCFVPARHAHCRIPCPPDMDCSLGASLRPNMLFASATHARALHAHNKLWLLWKTRKGQWARTCATFHAVTKSVIWHYM